MHCSGYLLEIDVFFFLGEFFFQLIIRFLPKYYWNYSGRRVLLSNLTEKLLKNSTIPRRIGVCTFINNLTTLEYVNRLALAFFARLTLDSKTPRIISAMLEQRSRYTHANKDHVTTVKTSMRGSWSVSPRLTPTIFATASCRSIAPYHKTGTRLMINSEKFFAPPTLHYTRVKRYT